MSRLNFVPPALSLFDPVGKARRPSSNEPSSNEPSSNELTLTESPLERWPGRRAGTISFSKAAAELRPGHIARWVRATCPDCGGRDVRAITLNDARRDEDGGLIPGSESIVGHRCVGCRREWPVMPRAEGCG